MNKKIKSLVDFLESKGIYKEEIQPYLSQIEKDLKNKKYGLVWEEQQEDVYENLKNNFPILREIKNKEIKASESDLTHLLIEGDNLEVLTSLQYSHKELIDVILIDPPYFTGNEDFRYNDNFVNKEDVWKHSKWLSFMDKRLKLCLNLLSDDGVIFINIDDNEVHQLKLLCDSIFGETNHISTFVWEKTQHFGRQKKNCYSNCEYILCYARNLYFKDYDKNKTKMKELLVEYKKTEFEDAPLYNKSNKEKIITFPAKTVHFNIPNGDYSKTTNEKYKLLSDVKVMDGINSNDFSMEFKSRWQQSTIEEHINNGGAFIVKSEGFAIRAIYGDKSFNESSKQLIFTNKNNELCTRSRFGESVGTTERGSSLLASIIGEDKFDYPKPTSLVKYLISLIYDYKKDVHKNNFTILDFFAGSGTTGHAVLELNKEDNGARQFILCTNNEKNICEDVTYQRLEKVINGYTSLEGKKNDGIGGNMKYYKVELEQDLDDPDDNANKLIDKCIDLVSIKENCFNKVKSNNLYEILENKSKVVLIYKDINALDYEVKEVSKILEEYTDKTKILYSVNTSIHIDDIKIKEYPSEILEKIKIK